MKKQNVIIIVSALVILIAVFTNPNLITHQQAIKSVFHQNIEKTQSELMAKANDEYEEAGANMGIMLGSALVDKMIENMVTSDNYIVCSTTKVTFEGKTKVIGLGLFGNVFLSDQVMEVIQQPSN
jgi:hypothetical protein